MSDYISREAAIEEAKKSHLYFDLKPILQRVPAADVVPVVKAEWYGEADGYADGELVYDMWSCPICGKRFEEWEEKPDWNFCPNCGADMRGDSQPSFGFSDERKEQI